MSGTFIIIMILKSFTFVFGVEYSTCYEYETYCLFSFGPNVTVNNVKEAQKICEDAKHGSWLLEIVDDRTLKNVEEFLSKHSFPEDTKLILNARKVGDTWMWMKNKSNLTKIIGFMYASSNILLYTNLKNGREDFQTEFAIICMADCYSKLKRHFSGGFEKATYKKNLTKGECFKECEVTQCDAWRWNYRYGRSYGCWTNITETNISPSPDRTTYELDRSVKTTSICIGNLTEKSYRNLNNCRASMLTLILVHSIPMVFLIALITFLGFVVQRKMKSGTTDEEEEMCDQKEKASCETQRCDDGSDNPRMTAKNKCQSAIEDPSDHVYTALNTATPTKISGPGQVMKSKKRF